ncbi:dihydrofolate reductase family protein [Phytohabitans flavus]|uniref:Deaminase reductase n=1 Tax=Phytohabitans flavus TaxID=1076124 RepID=A0A6F8XPC8_9ACTN|nr:dihydrofolate reductase family protein [Phytohabitans flavus]BCB75601.1 deaminase reductase [Phytohabitans flavus]
MRLTVTEFLSLDGVAQGPGSPDEDRGDGFTQGGWMVPHMDEAFLDVAADWLGGADAFLFGRRTYENFAIAWPKVTDPDDPFAPKLNGLPKFVASRTLTSAEWAPSTILSGDLATEVAALKRRPGRELQVHGSAELAQSLLAAGLVDEFRLVIAPVVLGHGRRLFPVGGAPAGLRVTRNETTPGGLVIQVFETIGAPRYGTYPG